MIIEWTQIWTNFFLNLKAYFFTLSLDDKIIIHAWNSDNLGVENEL